MAKQQASVTPITLAELIAPMTDKVREQASNMIHKERVQMLLSQDQTVFFSFLAMNLMPKEEQASISCATDGVHIYYNPQFIVTLTQPQLRGLLCHEVMHPALCHLWRRGSRDKDKFNRACDYAINDILIANGFELPQSIPPLYDEKFKGMSAEEIYTLLEDPPQQSGGGEGQPCQGGQGGEGQGQTPSLGKGQSLDGKGTMDNHDFWDKSEGKDKNKDDKDSKDGEGDGQEGQSAIAKQATGEGIWRERIARAANQARLKGKLPANLEELIEGTLQPKLPWRELLANFVVASTRTNYRTMPPSKKYLHVPCYIPSLSGESIEFGVAVDTSGSIRDEELNQFISEIKNISDNFEDFHVHLFGCDAQMHDYYEIEPYDEWPKTYHGRGGTSFVPVFDYIKKEALGLSCLVYLTDSYGTFPDCAPDYPVMWVINNPQGTAPWGEIIRLDVNDERN